VSPWKLEASTSGAFSGEPEVRGPRPAWMAIVERSMLHIVDNLQSSWQPPLAWQPVTHPFLSPRTS
jgi:hypothetical protein